MMYMTMSRAVAIILRPTPGGWAVCLTDGHQLARFRGPGARIRAQLYLARYLSAGISARTSFGRLQPR
jgi:hypothetical protein